MREKSFHRQCPLFSVENQRVKNHVYVSVQPYRHPMWKINGEKEKTVCRSTLQTPLPSHISTQINRKFTDWLLYDRLTRNIYRLPYFFYLFLECCFFPSNFTLRLWGELRNKHCVVMEPRKYANSDAIDSPGTLAPAPPHIYESLVFRSMMLFAHSG